MSHDKNLVLGWFARHHEGENGNERFANNLRRYLQVISKDRHQYGQKEGKLVSSALHRVVTGIPGYSERVFKKRIKNPTLDVCVQLVNDFSGSMSGRKFAHAGQACALLSHAIGNVLHIPVEVLGFSTDHAGGPPWMGGEEVNKMFILRKFEDQFVSHDKLIDRFAEAGAQSLMNNMDGEAVLFAYNRLIQQRAKKKIMIVLSDGQPACDRIGDYVGFLREVTNKIQTSRKDVRLIGVGILDYSVRDYYKNNVVINKPEEIETKLLDLLKQNILN